MDQNILLFDEPTAGMDPKKSFRQPGGYGNLNDEGKTIVIASHRMEELAEVTNDLSIMHAGQVEISGKSKNILQNTTILRQTGLEPPLAVRLSRQLIMNGWPIDGKNTTTGKRLIQTIREVTR